MISTRVATGIEVCVTWHLLSSPDDLFRLMFLSKLMAGSVSESNMMMRSFNVLLKRLQGDYRVSKTVSLLFGC
jgi:hypothetical protein